MSKLPSKTRQHLANLKSQGIILPEQRNPQQLWLLVVMHPSDTHSGEVFLTHGRNFDKFSNKPGFEVVAHGWDREDLNSAARKLRRTLGPNYQSKFSNPNPAPTKPVVDEPSESQLVTSDTPDDFLDAVGEIKHQSYPKET